MNSGVMITNQPLQEGFRCRRWSLMTFFLCFSLLMAAPAWADDETDQSDQSKKTIAGVVRDKTGETVIGASVTVKENPALGTATDVDGKYSITTSPNSTLIFTYLGYKQQEIPLKGKSVVDVVLEEDVQALEEVVVTGYQTISRERSTAAYSILDKDELAKNISTNALSALEGKVSGINTYDGSVVVRGVSTFSGDVGSDPLLVVDGLPTQKSLSDFSTDDIESITVLKDAAATSIYGVRAANGVIVITTKKAEKGRLKVNFSSTLSATPQAGLDDYGYASTAQILDYSERYYQGNVRRNTNGEAGYFEGKGRVGSKSISYYSPYDELHRQLYLGNITRDQFNQQVALWGQNDYRTEYQDLVTRTPITQNYNLSVAKESGGINTYLSIGYTNNNLQAIKYNSGESLKAYLKVGMKLTDWLDATVGMDSRFSSSHTTNGAASSNLGTDLEPYSTILNPDGTRAYRDWVNKGSGGYAVNPLVLEDLESGGYANLFKPYSYNVLDDIENNYTDSNGFSMRSFFDLKFKLAKGLSFSSSFSYELNKNRSEATQLEDSYALRFFQNESINPTKSTVQPVPDGAKFTRSQSESNNYIFRNQLDYNVNLKEKHDIVALAGIELSEQNYPQSVSRTLYGYDPQDLSYQYIDENTWINQGYPSYIYSGTNNSQIKIPKEGMSQVKNRFVSLYGNASYMYNNRYGITGSIRVDQTNLFTTDPKYRYRPLWSLGLTWNMKQEEFLKNVDWLNNLKLRATYGVGGNVDKNSTPYLVGKSSTSGYRIDPIDQMIISDAPNPLLRWEETTTYDFGFDYAILNNKLYGSVDAYYKYSDDLLCWKTNDYSSGFTKSMVNNGAMSNTGMEMSLRSQWLDKKDWKLNSSLIVSYNKNKVVRVGIQPTTADQLISGGDYFEEGYARDGVYAYDYGGITSGGTDAQNGIPYVLGEDGKTNVVLNPDGSVSYYQLNDKGDVHYEGTSTPPVSVSFNQGVKFKNFDLNALFTYYGGHVIRTPSVSIMTSPGSTLSRDVFNTDIKLYPDYNSDQITNLDTYVDKYWRLADCHIVRGDFIRLSNITLGYTFPAAFLKKLHLQNAKLSFQINNPWYWSAAGKGIDPQTRGRNETGWTLPRQDSYVIRLDVTF